jgi:adenine-specific DNA-methyltransferase
MLGFENHLNVFHKGRYGLEEKLARGLSIFLNSTFVDDYFRCFSGHTQVNANDLRRLKYPSRAALEKLGGWDILNSEVSQDAIDRQIENIAN